MKKSNLSLKKVVAIITLIIVVLNLILFAFNIYSWKVFWIILIICALIAFHGLKMIDKRK